jgi:YbbR domain-containing protein
MEQVEHQPDSTAQATPADPRARTRSRIVQFGDIGTLLLSAVLALTIWLIAINQENPLTVRQLNAPIPLTLVGLGEGLEVVQDLSNESVVLEVRAPRTSWESMRDGDFRATLDLTGLGPGEHDVSVKVTRRDPQMTVLEVQRPEYTVALDARIEKEAPVQVEIMDGAAFGYEWQAPIYTPITVTVSGPQSQVEQVTRARAEIYLRSAKSQVERTQTLVPVDAQGRVVERVTVAPPGRVQVVVPVEQWPGRKEVAVRVKLSGPPADGYRLSAVRSEPSTIVLQGDPAILSEVPGFVETEPLDLTDATADVRKRVALLLPEGVTSYDGDFVMATAGVTPIEGGITVAEPLVVRGLGAGLTAAAALDEVDVILSGPMPLLESMNEDDVFAILDLSGLVPGTHALKPSVVRPGGISLDGVIPETVEVVIRLQETGATGELPQVPDVEATAAAITPTATLTVAAAAGMTIPSTLPAVTPTVTAPAAETPATATPLP